MNNVDKSNEWLDIKMLSDQANSFFAVAWMGYRERGRGVVIVKEEGFVKNAFCQNDPEGWPPDALSSVLAYDPEREVVIVFARGNYLAVYVIRPAHSLEAIVNELMPKIGVGSPDTQTDEQDHPVQRQKPSGWIRETNWVRHCSSASNKRNQTIQ